MRRYLIVAHKTLGGEHLFEALHKLREEHADTRFHLIVPVEHPMDHSWIEGEVQARAAKRLDWMLDTMASMGMGASGEVGDANPVYAVGVAIRREPADAFSGIVLSTLPKGISRWMFFDVPKRMAREYPNHPLMHVVQSRHDERVEGLSHSLSESVDHRS